VARRRRALAVSLHAEGGLQGEEGGLRLPWLPPPAARSEGAQGSPVVGPVRRRRLHGHGPSRRRGGRVLQAVGRVVEDPRVRAGSVQRRDVAYQDGAFRLVSHYSSEFMYLLQEKRWR